MTRAESNWATEIILLGSGLLGPLAMSALSPVLPKIESAFGGSAEAAYLTKAIVMVVGIAMILVSPLTGTIARRFGRRRVLIWSYAIFLIAGLAGAFFDSLAAIVASRFLVGAAGAACVTLAITLIADLYEGGARERRIGANHAIGALLLSGLMPVAGYLGDVAWRLAFAVHLIVMPLLIASLLSSGLPEGEDAAVSRRRDVQAPLRPLAGIAALALAAGSITFSVAVFTPFHLRDLHIPSAGVAGEMISLTVFCSVATSFAYGELRRFLSAQIVFCIAFALWATGFALVAQAQSLGPFALGMSIAGMGGGLVGPNIFSVASSVGRPEARSRNIGIVKGIYYAGPFVGPSLLQMVSQRYTAGGAILTLSIVAAMLAAICTARLAWGAFPRGAAAPIGQSE